MGPVGSDSLRLGWVSGGAKKAPEEGQRSVMVPGGSLSKPASKRIRDGSYSSCKDHRRKRTREIHYCLSHHRRAGISTVHWQRERERWVGGRKKERGGRKKTQKNKKKNWLNWVVLRFSSLPLSLYLLFKIHSCFLLVLSFFLVLY